MAVDKASELIARALEHLRYQKYDSAISDAREALQHSPNSAEAYNVLGIALSRTNKASEAADALRKAIDIAPDNAKGYYNLAAHYYAFGDKPTALIAAQQALEKDPNHQAARELTLRIQQEQMPGAQERVPPQFGQYIPTQPTKPVHSIKFIEALGWAWDAAGWFIVGALLVTYLVVQARVNAINLSPNPEDVQATYPALQKFLSENLRLFVATLVWLGLLWTWWTLDLFDRRPAGGLVALGVIGMFGPCCYLTYIAFPLYAISRRLSQPK